MIALCRTRYALMLQDSRIAGDLNDADPEDQADWGRQHEWLGTRLNELRRVFALASAPWDGWSRAPNPMQRPLSDLNWGGPATGRTRIKLTSWQLSCAAAQCNDANEGEGTRRKCGHGGKERTCLNELNRGCLVCRTNTSFQSEKKDCMYQQEDGKNKYKLYTLRRQPKREFDFLPTEGTADRQHSVKCCKGQRPEAEA
jgi:hypothetical protein